MTRTKKTLYVLSWVPAFIVKLALALLGLVLVPIGILTKYMSVDGHDPEHWPDLLWLWHNVEDGDDPNWWKARHPKWPTWWRQFVWLAIRNPVNNLRYLLPDYVVFNTQTNWSTVNPMEARWIELAGMRMAYRWVWRGWFAGYRRVWLTKPGKYSEIWFGWKLGSSVPGLGFTVQIRLNRDIGT